MYGVPALAPLLPHPSAPPPVWTGPNPAATNQLPHGAVLDPGVGVPPIDPTFIPAGPPPPPPAGPPKYNLSLDPGVILSQSQAKAAREAALRAHQHALLQIGDVLAGRGLTRSGETRYRTGEENYGYGNTVTGINNTALQAYIAAWQYAQQHPELYSGITGLPAELGG